MVTFYFQRFATICRRVALAVFLLALSQVVLSQAASAQQTYTPITQPDCGGPSITPTPTNAGTDFMLCFEENIDTGFFQEGAYLEIYIASLDDSATVTITTRLHPSFLKTVFLQPHSSLTERISADSVDIGNGQKSDMHDLFIMSDEIPDNAVVEVQATSPIVCYGMDYKNESADAFCALPQDYAGTDYEVICYRNSDIAAPYTCSQFAVAAFEDNDTVTIIPSAPTLSGNLAGVPMAVVLQHGQCVQVQAFPDPGATLDLTGSQIRSNHPITVYSGHERTEAPSLWQQLNETPSRDNLLEVMPPTSTWGENFVLNPFVLDTKGTIGPQGDVMRILALNDSTKITVNGTPWTTVVNGGEFRDAMVTGPTLVQSSGPVLVGEIEHSDYYLGLKEGDPSLSIVPPVDQTYNNYTFFAGDGPDFPTQFVIIGANTQAENNISIDGTPILGASFSPVPGSVNGATYAVENCPITAGMHIISSSTLPSEGFTILAYGLSSVISYGYTAGSLLVPKRAIRIENPPQSIGGIGTNHSNRIQFHNTAYQPAYLDSAIFVPDDPKDAAFGVHASENVGLDIGRMDIGGSSEIHIVAKKALPHPVSGRINIYSHLPSYFDIEPAETRFTLYPDYAASVGGSNNNSFTATANPNPFTTSTTLQFSVPESTPMTIALYDALGRKVRTLAATEFPAGPYSIRIDRNGLPHGVYVCTITSNALNLHARVPIIVGE
ncbi:MAG TPA: T9SS type A sorting domain-containing protein [Candidatus Kapabacteria bacterium]